MSFNQLLAIYEENRQDNAFWKAQVPRACPNDGTPLTAGPNDNILFCPHDGWQYPRDYDPETMAGI
jgi:hypothetical protein